MTIEQRSLELAAEIKALITCEGLHCLIQGHEALCRRVALFDFPGVPSDVQFGWALDAERKIADVITRALHAGVGLTTVMPLRPPSDEDRARLKQMIESGAIVAIGDLTPGPTT